MRLGLSAGFKEQESTCGPVLELSASVPPILSDAENRLAHFAVPSPGVLAPGQWIDSGGSARLGAVEAGDFQPLSLDEFHHQLALR